jgi:predicted dehydrogenase
MVRLGIIGAGTRAAWIAACLQAVDSDVTLAAVADPNPALARQRLAHAGVAHDKTRFHPHAEAMLEEADRLDGVVIGTHCDLHTAMAVKVAPTGLPVFIEKPVAIWMDEVHALHQAFRGREHSVVVSFPLRVTPLFQNVLEVIRSGRLGTINQVQAFNAVPYGGVYFGQWYRNHDATGGLWLQKATHDFDYINHIIAEEPTAVVATSTRKVYGGHMPAELHCSSCTASAECPESPAAIAAREDDGGMGMADHACAFSKSIKHHDAGSALVMYAGGTHAAYSQNFVSRRSAGARGARVTGYLGTLTFDWYTDSIQIIEHHGTGVENYKVNVPEGHHGGDSMLSRNFVDVMRGRDVSRVTLREGILSAAMCLAARASETTRHVEPVVVPAQHEIDVAAQQIPTAVAPRQKVIFGPGMCGMRANGETGNAARAVAVGSPR